MTNLIRHLSKGLLIIAVVGGLTFGSVNVAQGMWPPACGEDAGELGECPPFNDDTCHGACFLKYGYSGECMQHPAGPDCCICQI